MIDAIESKGRFTLLVEEDRFFYERSRQRVRTCTLQKWNPSIHAQILERVNISTFGTRNWNFRCAELTEQPMETRICNMQSPFWSSKLIIQQGWIFYNLKLAWLSINNCANFFFRKIINDLFSRHISIDARVKFAYDAFNFRDGRIRLWS